MFKTRHPSPMCFEAVASLQVTNHALRPISTHIKLPFWCSGHRSYLSKKGKKEEAERGWQWFWPSSLDTDFQKILGSANPCSLPPCSRSDCLILFVSAQSSTTHQISSNLSTLFGPLRSSENCTLTTQDLMLTGIAEDLSAIHSKVRHFLVNKSLWCLKKDLGTRPCPRRSGCYQRFSSPFWNEPPHMDVPGHNHTVDSGKIWKSKENSPPELNFRPCGFWLVGSRSWLAFRVVSNKSIRECPKPLTTHSPEGPRKPWHWGCLNAQLEGPPGRCPEHRSQHVPGGPRSGWRYGQQKTL